MKTTIKIDIPAVRGALKLERLRGFAKEYSMTTGSKLKKMGLGMPETEAMIVALVLWSTCKHGRGLDQRIAQLVVVGERKVWIVPGSRNSDPMNDYSPSCGISVWSGAYVVRFSPSNQ